MNIRLRHVVPMVMSLNCSPTCHPCSRQLYLMELLIIKIMKKVFATVLPMRLTKFTMILLHSHSSTIYKARRLGPMDIRLSHIRRSIYWSARGNIMWYRRKLSPHVHHENWNLTNKTTKEEFAAIPQNRHNQSLCLTTVFSGQLAFAHIHIGILGPCYPVP